MSKVSFLAVGLIDVAVDDEDESLADLRGLKYVRGTIDTFGRN